jgi:peptidoglycan/xylan/chitin deacetylase (PgdA/CDA1 family)
MERSSARLAGARYRIDPTFSAVALTFDDGPDPRFTPLVLETLAALGVKATFFVVGDQAEGSPHLVQRIVDEGHAIGTHSRLHPDPTHLGFRLLQREYGAGRHTVEAILGASVPLFRPPRGRIDPGGAAAIRANRLEAWLWTIDAADWRPGTRVHDLVAATSVLAPGDVVLLHDGIRQPLTADAEDRSATVEGLEEIVSRARSRGLQFMALPAGR